MLSIVVSGPGGVGKGTLVDRLLANDPTIRLSRSWTTRAPRPGEAPDAYVFTDAVTFDRNIDAGGFLEWVQFLDYRQGTPMPDPGDGRDILFEIDVTGARRIREWDPDALLVFVDTPDQHEQRQRLLGRGDPEEIVERRMIKGEEERDAARELGMYWIINDDLDTAVEEIEALIAAARERAAEES